MTPVLATLWQAARYPLGVLVPHCSLHSWNTVKTVTFSEAPWGWGLLALGRSLTVTRDRAAFPGRDGRGPGRNLGAITSPKQGRHMQTRTLEAVTFSDTDV